MNRVSLLSLTFVCTWLACAAAASMAVAAECIAAPDYPCPTPEHARGAAELLRDLTPAALVALTFGALSFGAHVRAAKREGRRYACSAPVTIRRDDSDHVVVIVNISQRGARLRLEDIDLNPGEDIALESEDLDKSAKVIWVGGGEAGVAFHATLTAQSLNAIRRRKA